MRRLILSTLTSALLVLALAATAQAATTYTVNTTADSTDANGCTTNPTCSLRDAIAAANTGNGDTVVVPAGTYTLNTVAADATAPGELVVQSNMTITGAGARSTVVDANKRSRVFAVANTNLTVKIAGLTVTGGQVPDTNTSSNAVPFNGTDGGGILTCGNLELDGVTVTGNTSQILGGGIASPSREDGERSSCGLLSLEAGTRAAGRVSVAPRGFVTLTLPTVTLNGSTVSNNTIVDTTGGALGRGGGVYVSGNLNVTNSTISGNSVATSGSNIGGGIGADSGTVTLLNATIAGNSVTAGAMATGGGLGGSEGSNQVVGATLSAQNTIVAGNTASGAENDCQLAPVAMTRITGFTVGRTDHNLSGDASCGFTDAGSKQSTDPALGALANNGGQTDTRAIATGSPALDAGDNTGCPATDQIGTARPQNGICDIGAFEYIPKADIAVSDTAAPSSVIAGANVTYTVTVRNNGPDTGTGVTLADTLGAGQFARSVTASQGSCTTGPIVCSLGTLASGASATVTVVAGTSKLLGASTRAAPRATTSVTDSAVGSAAQIDPNPANNSASASALVLAATAPRITTNNNSRRGARGCVASGLTLPVRIASATSVRQVRVTLNGKLILTTSKRSFTIRVAAGRLRAGRNVIVVTARNASGNGRTTRLTVIRCAARVKPRPRPRPIIHPHRPAFTG